MAISHKVWMEQINPLIGLSIKQAQAIYDCARAGGSPLLQRIYAEIEAIDPVLMTCVERRGSALTGLGWRAVARSGGDDEGALADEQRDAVRELCDGIGNLDEAIEHLDQAFFRGYAHVQPLIQPDGSVKQFELLNSWNFLRGPRGEWLWNPECQLSPEGLDDCAGAGLISISRPRAIDYPVMAIYIRRSLGERDWGRYLERHAIPKPAVTMPPGTTDAQKADFVQSVEQVEDGRASVWPNGTVVSDFASASRGQDPFSAFVAHQEKLIVLAATGGTLTSLAEAGSGTLAGSAHMEVWREIVARDADIIGSAINRMMVEPYLRRRFPGQPILAGFELGADAEPNPDELFELASKARAAGYLIDRQELSEHSGYTLEREETAPQGMPFGFNEATPLQNDANALQNARNAVAEPMPASGEMPTGTILDALRADLGGAADEVIAALSGKAFTAEEARALRDKLGTMIPKTPALAQFLEMNMAEAFAQAGGENNGR